MYVLDLTWLNKDCSAKPETQKRMLCICSLTLSWVVRERILLSPSLNIKTSLRVTDYRLRNRADYSFKSGGPVHGSLKAAQRASFTPDPAQ